MTSRLMVMAAMMPLMWAGSTAAQIADRVGGADDRGSHADRERLGRGTGVVVSVERWAAPRWRICRYDVRLDGRFDEWRDDRYGRRDDRIDSRLDARIDARYDERIDRRYDERWDRAGGRHEWSGPYAGGYSRDCLVFVARVGWTRDRGNDWAYHRDLMRLTERLDRMHAEWHRRHGWFPRNRGWVHAHRALHERLAREYDRFWHRHW